MTTCLISHLSPATTPTHTHYNTIHHAGAHPEAFDRSRGFLFVQTPDPLTAEVLAHRFHTTIMRTAHNLQLALDELLARCGMDQQTYQQRALRLRRRAAHDTTPTAQDTTPGVQDTTPSAQDTTKHYKEERLREEVWRTIKEALKLEISPSNYHTYLQDTHAITFNRDTGTLLVEAASPVAATQLNSYFAMTIRRAVVNTNASIHGVPISEVDFVPRAQGPWHNGDDPQPEE